MKNAKGRKPLLDQKQTKELINKFVIKHGVAREIKYADMHKFCCELYFLNQISTLPSESFWRKKDRAGRKAIDEVNKVLFKKQHDFDSKSESAHLLRLIDTKIDNSELKNVLISEIKSYQRKNEIHKLELQKQEETLRDLYEKIENLSLLNKNQQNLISQMMYYFLKSSSDSNRIFFESAFKDIFSNPIAYVDKLTEENVTQQNNNLVNLFKSRLK